MVTGDQRGKKFVPGAQATSLEEAPTTTEMLKLMKYSEKDLNNPEMSRDLEMSHDEEVGHIYGAQNIS